MFNTVKLNESIIGWLRVVVADTNLIITSKMSENLKETIITSEVGDEKVITDEENGFMDISFPNQTKTILYTSIFTIIFKSHAKIDDEARENANILVDKLEDNDTLPTMKELKTRAMKISHKFRASTPVKQEGGEKKLYVSTVKMDIIVTRTKTKNLNIWRNSHN